MIEEKKDKHLEYKENLLKIFRAYNKIYYISISLNFLVLLSILTECLFIFLIKHNPLFVTISLVSSLFLITISLFVKFHLNTVFYKILNLLETIEIDRKQITSNFNYIVSVLRILSDKSNNNQSLIQLIRILDFDYKNEKLQLKEKETATEKIVNDNE